MSEPDDRIDAQAAALRQQGDAVLALLSEYLGAITTGPVLPAASPQTMLERWPGEFPEEPAADRIGSLRELVGRVLNSSTRLHHPHFIGHQVSAPEPLTALLELVAALLNNGMAVYEMGPAGTAMEKRVLDWMAGQLGMNSTAGGVLTSGGSLGNLTALSAARNARAGFDAWADGVHAGEPLAILASSQTHYSVSRAAAILGLGASGVIPVNVDERYRLRADELPAALHRAQANGRRVVAVVGNACSTATGAFDPLPAIADFAEEHDLWFHVDAAHGGAAALSPRYRGLLAGIERADSVVWDAHKMLRLPALVTAVLYRDRADAGRAFTNTQASYLFDEAATADIGRNTVECTKRMMSLELYGALALLGTRSFTEHVETLFGRAARLGAMIANADDFQLVTPPQCNIVCFRHCPSGLHGPALDAHQEWLLARLLASGDWYLVKTRLPAGLFLRVTIMNELTTDGDLEHLMRDIRSLASTRRESTE